MKVWIVCIETEPTTYTVFWREEQAKACVVSCNEKSAAANTTWGRASLYVGEVEKQ